MQDDAKAYGRRVERAGSWGWLQVIGGLRQTDAGHAEDHGSGVRESSMEGRSVHFEDHGSFLFSHCDVVAVGPSGASCHSCHGQFIRLSHRLKIWQIFNLLHRPTLPQAPTTSLTRASNPCQGCQGSLHHSSRGHACMFVLCVMGVNSRQVTNLLSSLGFRRGFSSKHRSF